MMRGKVSALWIAFFCLTISWSALGQVRDTASVFGTVTDPQGAVVPEAKVTLTSAATAQERTVTTDNAGGYLYSLLPVGSYHLSVESPGFNRYERTGILLQANENVKVDVALQVGDVQTIVTVDALVSQVETRAVTIKETVDARRVVELPLNGRNPADLVLLAAGVVPGAGQDGGRGGIGQKRITVNGSRQNNLRYTLDGADNNDNLLNLNLPFPFPDAVQEFSAQTSNMGVELGGSSGGVLNVVTRSGTNDLHASGFWFLRNTELNASNFFSRQQDQLKRNQAGFTAGGPIVRNKIFGFVGYQRLWIRTAPGDLRAQTFTAPERQGDFSGSRVIGDPLNNSAPFPNNSIPQPRFNPSALLLLKDTPVPDADGFARYNVSRPEDGRQIIARGDYVASNNHSFYVRYFEQTNERPFDSSTGRNLISVQSFSTLPTKNGTLAYNYIVSPTMLMHTQFTASHFVDDSGQNFPNCGHTTYLLKINPKDCQVDIDLVDTRANFKAGAKGHFTRANFELIHDWTWTKGQHNFVWGAQFTRKRFNNDTTFRSSGHWEFDGHVTGLESANGVDRADFLLGGFSFYQQNNGEIEQRRGLEQGYHFGDTWRLSSRFTLTLGVRYEPLGLFADLKDRNQTFDIGNYSKGIGSKIFLEAPPGLLYRGDDRPSGYPGGGGQIGKTVTEPDFNNWAPRIGIAWDPFGDGKTSIRSGYAIFYDSPQLASQNDANNVSPFSYNVEFIDGQLDDPFLGRTELNRFPISQFLPDTPFALPLYTVVLDGKFLTAYTQNWSLTVEREITADTRFRVGYVGTKATHLKTEYDQNPPIYDFSKSVAENRATTQQRRILQPYQEISRWMHGLNSTYHSLQASVDKRYSHGFTVSAAYTWAKTLDYISQNGFGGRDQINNPFNFFFARGLSNQHRPHRLVTSFVWDLPTPAQMAKPLKAVIGDWRFSGIVTLQAGRPFDMFSVGLVGLTAGRARLDLVGTGDPVLDTGRSKGEKIDEYFDTSRFAEPAGGTFGTLGRNVMLGPGLANFDMALVKSWRWLPHLGEKGLVEFRFEAFNLFNATHLTNPVTQFGNVNFGKITGTDGDPRILQMALKIGF